MNEGTVRAMFIASGALMIATAVWMVVDPGGFVSSIASFGEPSDHFVRDIATFLAPYGVAMVLAGGHPTWRLPVVGLALVQNGFHLVNHIADIDRTTTAWHGPTNVIALAILEVWFVFMFIVSRRVVAVEH